MTYFLNEGDREIIGEALKNPNLFTDWYFRGRNTGTWASPDATDSRIIALYDDLHRLWEDKNKEEVFEYRGHDVKVVYRTGFVEPFFQIQHGFLFQKWQEEWFLAPQKTRVVVGGFGSGKTIASLMQIFIYAAVLPGFRALVLAPYFKQIEEIFFKGVQMMEGTRYAERFMIRRMMNSRNVRYIIGNQMVGENHIDFVPMLDDPKKILTFEADMAMIDQVEQFPDIPELRRVVASRLRGFYQGRERLGIVNYIGNPYDNFEMWDLYDEAEDNPREMYALRVSSYDNTALSEDQLRRYERDVGEDAATRNTFLHGYRPVGDGKHFPASSVNLCRDPMLDKMMEEALAEKRPGWICETAPKVGIYRWEMPPIEGRNYVVIADPGWGNPPKRNAACIGVWDITDFPTIPARISAFHWVFGYNSPDPWIESFSRYVMDYKAVGKNAFDATGQQQGYDRWVEIFNQLLSEPMRMTGSNKYLHLNALKVLMARGMIKFPTIQGIISQLAKYNIPDDALNQDIVMMMALTCSWLERFYYVKPNNNYIKPKKRIDRFIYHSRSGAHKR